MAVRTDRPRSGSRRSTPPETRAHEAKATRPSNTPAKRTIKKWSRATSPTPGRTSKQTGPCAPGVAHARAGEFFRNKLFAAAYYRRAKRVRSVTGYSTDGCRRLDRRATQPGPERATGSSGRHHLHQPSRHVGYAEVIATQTTVTQAITQARQQGTDSHHRKLPNKESCLCSTLIDEWSKNRISLDSPAGQRDFPTARHLLARRYSRLGYKDERIGVHLT